MKKYIGYLENDMMPDLFEQEFKNADRIEKIRLGQHCLFVKKLFRIFYISYEKIDAVYLRIEGGESGDFSVDEVSVVILDNNGSEHRVRMSHPGDAKKAIEEIIIKRPEIKNEVPESV